MTQWIISSSILILAVLLVRQTLGRRIGLRLRYALWALVLVRLLVPFQFFTSTLSVSGAAQKLEVDLAQPVRRAYTAVQASRYQAEYNAIYEQILQSEQPVAPDTASVERETLQRVEEKQEADVASLLYGIWIAGMAVLGLILMGCNGHFALGLRRSRKHVEDAVCLLPVYESAVVPTPCIFGLFRPAVYLTPEVAGDSEARGHVLAHEMTHYRHLDHIWAVLRNVCLVLHWYNPLVWVAFRLSREDAELACDEGALLLLGEDQRSDYGRTLIRLTCGEGLTTGLIAATTMTGSARSIARRLKTIMKRRRTTLLALIALVLAGAVAIGCTFSGAPETTEPGESTPAQTTPSEETTPAAELPLIDDGVIVYPGTMWNMTPEEVKAALGLKEADCTTYVDVVKAVNYAVYGFAARNQTFLGFPVTLNFEFRALTRELKLGLCVVTVYFETERDLATVQGTLWERLGGPVHMTSGPMSAEWASEAVLTDFIDRDFWTEWKDYGDGSDPASRLYLRGPGVSEKYELVFTSNLVLQQLAEQGHTPEDDMSYQGQELPIPDFTEPPEGTLTQEQIDQVNAAFAPILPDENDPGSMVGNPISCFFTAYYNDVRELDLREFLRYCPVSEPATEEEYQLLQQMDDFPYTGTFAEMPVPLHRYPAEKVDALLREYTGLGLRDRYEREEVWSGLYYLAETDCYYNTTSDAGFGMFACTGGTIYEDHVELYSGNAVLILREEDGKYYIESHLPLADENAAEEAIARTLEAFFLAYEENINLQKDHSYDHLTVLAADPERTVEVQGKTVPLSDFYGNIEYLHGKEAVWKHIRRDGGINEETFEVTSRVEEISYDGDTATVLAHDNVSFYYTGLGAPSGMGASFEVLLVQVDGEWLIADIFEQNDWFDAEHKNDPNFDPDKAIASYP